MPWRATHGHWLKKRFESTDKRDECRSVRSCGFGMVTWLTLVFYCHLGKIAFLPFCPQDEISVHCVVLAYQSYISLQLSMWPEHLMRYNKVWLLWISCILCHASPLQCSAPRNFSRYAFQHIFSRPILLFLIKSLWKKIKPTTFRFNS